LASTAEEFRAHSAELHDTLQGEKVTDFGKVKHES
jgi:hypothetical protein